MDQQSALFPVWREACRHIEISQSAENIAQALLEWLPLRQLWVRKVDRDRGCVETVAVGLATLGTLLPNVRGDCSPEQAEKFLRWAAEGELIEGNRRVLADQGLDFLLPKNVDGDILMGALGSAKEPSGLLILLSASNRKFEPKHIDVARALIEPFSLAMENDQRLRELTAWRDAAEADKRSLLTRLGRKELGDTIVGDETGLRSVMERVELVARSDAPVLIFGETGTGKELIARAIHQRSRRAAGPFARVNCGAIPPELIDSQLFGHERGAFTGAVETRRGWFERADGGTLFLDEIGELPLAAQVRMLRILQDGWMERVGGEQPINVNVRIVGATHRDLAAMVSAGQFREDLWYRLAVFPIVLPPLRERREDVAELAEHFAERAAVRFGLAFVPPSSSDIELLCKYSWPGNIRELGAVIDRAAILGDGRTLEIAKALGSSVSTSVRPQAAESSAAIAPSAKENELDDSRPLDSLEEVIRAHIEKALKRTRGRIEGPHGAALLLDINPHTLRAKMRKLGVDWKNYRGRGD